MNELLILILATNEITKKKIYWFQIANIVKLSSFMQIEKTVLVNFSMEKGRLHNIVHL